MDIDLEELATMVELLKEAEFTEFRYEKGDMRLVISRGAVTANYETTPAGVLGKPAVASASASAPALQPTKASSVVAEPAVHEGAEVVQAPLLGTFYACPKPGEPPFVRVGDRVEARTVLCIVEVMKLMNSVEAGCSGVIAAVHAEDGQLVEFGQSLFSIIPGDA